MKWSIISVIFKKQLFAYWWEIYIFGKNKKIILQFLKKWCGMLMTLHINNLETALDTIGLQYNKSILLKQTEMWTFIKVFESLERLPQIFSRDTEQNNQIKTKDLCKLINKLGLLLCHSFFLISLFCFFYLMWLGAPNKDLHDKSKSNWATNLVFEPFKHYSKHY